MAMPAAAPGPKLQGSAERRLRCELCASIAPQICERRHSDCPSDVDPHVAAVGPAQLLQRLRESR